MKYVVALDLATKTGWAAGFATLRPAYGTYKVEGSEGAFYAAFDEWLPTILGVYRDPVVIYESPVLPRFTRIETLRRLYWMGGHVEMICNRRGIACYEAPLTTVKKFWTGSGRAKKPDMVKAAQERGFAVSDDNQADALALWHYCCSSVCNAGRKRGRT
jgi:crossover junction endodeoxyribonuclease RuvC